MEDKVVVANKQEGIIKPIDVKKDLEEIMQSVVDDNEPDQAVIDRLTTLALSPEDLVTHIFDNPPAVTITNEEGKRIKLQPKLDISQPTPKEIEYARKEIPQPDGLSEDEKYLFDSAVFKLKGYLLAPRVSDGFTDHVKERSVWQQSVYGTLILLDSRRQSSRTTSDDDISYTEYFREKWDDNKYSTGKMSIYVHWGIHVAIIFVEDTGKSQYLDGLIELQEEYDLMLKPKKISEEPLEYDDPVKGKDINKVSKDVSAIAMEALGVLSKIT